jgi:hypothetical protein
MSGLLRLQTSAVFEDPGAGSFAATIQSPTLAANYVLTLPVDDGTSGQVLSTNGTGTLSWISPGGGGTVTNVATGTGLTGGPITGTGTISIASGGVSSTEIANDTIMDTDINSAAAIAWTKMANLTNDTALYANGTGDVTSLATVSSTELGYLDGVTGALQTQLGTKVNKAGDTMSGLLRLQTSAVFEDPGAGAFATTIQSATLAANYVLTLPVDDGTVGQLLQTDGAGVLSWVSGATPSGSAGGDLTGTYPNPSIAAGVIVDADINASAAITATKIAGGTVDNTEFGYINGVTGAIQTQLTAKLNKAGDTMTGELNMNAQNLIKFKDSDSSNFVAIRSPASVTTDVTLTLPIDDGTSGQVLSTDGTGLLSWISPGGGGTVTNIATGTGLTGGPITGSGTISIASGGVSSTEIANDTIMDTDINSAAAITATKIAGGTVDNTEFGYLNGTTAAVQTQVDSKVSKAGDTMSGLLRLQTSAVFEDPGAGSFAATIQSPTLAANYVLTLPVDDGTSGQLLQTNGSGVLSWVTGAAPSGSAGGDLSGTYPNPSIAAGVIVDADINASAAITATKIAGGTVDNTEFGYLNGTTAAVQTQVDSKVSKAGDTMSGLLRLQTSAVFEDPGVGTFAATIQSPTLAANYVLTLPVDDGTTGQLLQTDGAGVLSWVSGAAPSGAAGGDLTGTYPNPSIAAGVIVNADINAAAAISDSKLATIAAAGKVSNSATTATNLNTASAIVARDASGNFSAGTITAALTGAASSNVLKAGDTMTGDLTIAKTGPALILNETSGANWTTQFFQHSGVNKWYLGSAPTSFDFALYNYTTGSYAMYMYAASNNVQFTGTITGNGSGLTALNASNISSGTIANARTTATSSNTANAIVARDASGNFSAATISATFSGNGAALNSLNASNISSGTIGNAYTSGTSSWVGNALVLRDPSGNFSAGTITAALTGAASLNVLKTGDTMTGNLVAPIMYDYNNTGFYVDPNSTSTMYNLSLDGTFLSSLTSSSLPKFSYGYNVSSTGGYGSVAMGWAATASNTVSIAIGQSVLASGYSSVALGYSATANQSNSVAIGYGAVTSAGNEIALGGSFSTVKTGGTITADGANASLGSHPTYGDTYAAFWKSGNDYAMLAEAANTFINVPSSAGTIWFRSANVDRMYLGTSDLTLSTIDDIQRVSNGTLFLNYYGGNVYVASSSYNFYSLAANSYKPSGGSWAVYSDARVKDVQGDYSRGLDEIRQVDTIYFNYKKDNDMQYDSSKTYTGVIAQEMQKLIPEAVFENEDGYLVVNNDPIWWASVNAIKELDAIVEKNKEMFHIMQQGMIEQIEAHDRKIASLEEENIQLKKSQKELEQKYDRLMKALCKTQKLEFCE